MNKAVGENLQAKVNEVCRSAWPTTAVIPLKKHEKDMPPGLHGPGFLQ
jgi:hypothetical protein